jgi:uncharacterized protein YegP (UPF0339 family)
MDKVEVYSDAAGEWRWVRVAPNGRKLADSGEGYGHRSDCMDMARRVNGGDVLYVERSGQ